MRTNLSVVAMCLVLAGCQPGGPAPTAAPTAAAVTVARVKPEMRPVVRQVVQPGAVEAFEETVLYPKVPGYVKALAADPAKAESAAYDRFVDIGTQVKKDQVLLELAVPELDEEYEEKQALVRQAEAEVVQAEKSLAAAEAGVQSAKAGVTEARAALGRSQALYRRWESESARVTRLVGGGVIDSQSQDETLNQFKAAEATRAEADAKVASAESAVVKSRADADKARADVDAANARLDVAKAGARRTQAMRDYTRIKAPYDGVVTRRSVSTGDYVTADGKQGLLAVARLDPVRVVVGVPEADAGLVRVGQQVQLTLPTGGGPRAGKVLRTSWSLEPGSRTLRTELDLPNPEGATRPGMYVSARLTVEFPAAWALPTAAIGKSNDEPVAYLVEDNKAVRVVVEPTRGDVQFTQVARYKRPGQSSFTPFTGQETVATPATAVTDGQTIP